ncbi:MAG TPA: FAD:protein FMN transferase [Candidatus Paceibacterota bacterium]|jgi:thiamine biosynthesis lipoprotein|nr:FAD:protein FMN transferase [Candidatus Paceibacterota bacterium]
MASQLNFEAIGTRWHIDIYEALTSDQESVLSVAIHERIAIFDLNYSRFRADSLVTRMAHAAGTYDMPQDFKKMHDLYKKMYEVTDGYVTPLIGQTLSDAGYDAEYSLQQRAELHTPSPWEEIMQYDHPELVIKFPALLDFGAAGKGYLVDIVAEVIESYGIYQYCVDAGGDMVHRGGVPIKVGLEHPDNSDQVIGFVELRNNSVCGSAGNRRVWQTSKGTMHHIIDPKELSSPTNILAVWVIADTTLLADGLTTCLFFASPQALREHFTFDYLIMRPDHSVEYSDNFPVTLFTQ